MSIVFHEVSGYADCDENERGKRRRGGDPAAFWWFNNLRRGFFCVIDSKKLRSVIFYKKWARWPKKIFGILGLWTFSQ